VTRLSKATALVLTLLLLTGCGDDDGDGGGETTEAADGSDRRDLSSYDTVAAMNEDLAAAGIECALEYEGLVDDLGNEISQCTITPEGGAPEQAILHVYEDLAVLDALVAPEGAPPPPGVAYGANWAIEAGTPETAQILADALGGAVTGA